MLQTLPEAFPHGTTQPKFALGDRVQWQPRPTHDFGTVTGLQYTPAQHRHTWGWKYTVWLDANSPSRAWTTTDTAWEADLEASSATTQRQPLQESDG